MGTLRILLAFAVLFMHSSKLFGMANMGGTSAVQSFYVISGFYMALVLNEKYEKGRRGYLEFMMQRLMRLLPAYWFCVVAALVIYLIGAGVDPRFLNGMASPVEFWAQCIGAADSPTGFCGFQSDTARRSGLAAFHGSGYDRCAAFR